MCDFLLDVQKKWGLVLAACMLVTSWYDRVRGRAEQAHILVASEEEEPGGARAVQQRSARVLGRHVRAWLPRWHSSGARGEAFVGVLAPVTGKQRRLRLDSVHVQEVPCLLYYLIGGFIHRVSHV